MLRVTISHRSLCNTYTLNKWCHVPGRTHTSNKQYVPNNGVMSQCELLKHTLQYISVMLQWCTSQTCTGTDTTRKRIPTNLSNNDLMVEFVVHADSDGILPACLQHPVIARKDWESYEKEFRNSPDMNPTRNKHVHHVWCLVPVHMCIPYLPRAHAQGVEWLVVSVCLSVQRTPVIQAVLLVVKKKLKNDLVCASFC